jgi:UTP--glucose-1-phosphate uridylyltransferase
MHARLNSNSIRKAIILAGGWGTRFLPFTKAVPKEMLPIGNIPAIQHVVEECLRSGIKEITIVTRPGCDITRRHFEAAPLLESYLSRENLLAQQQAVNLAPVARYVTFVEERPADIYGSAMPLLQLYDQMIDEPAFAVAFADDVILGKPAIGELVQAFEQHRAKAAIALQRVPRHYLGKFGNVALGETLQLRAPSQFVVRDLIQRPSLQEIRSPYAVVSRLILTPTIFDHLATPAPNGEMDLGTAVARVAQTARVLGVKISGRWVTVGDPESYLQALWIASAIEKRVPNVR